MLLPYCVIEAAYEIAAPAAGVSGAGVEQFRYQELRVLCSIVPRLPVESEALRGEALRFHSVVHEIFKEVAVIPFRFPTLLEDEAELRRHLESCAAEYRDFLARTRDLVQMEVRLTRPVQPAPATGSGREYLENRLTQQREVETRANQVLVAARSLIREWKVRQTQRGVRCYALVARAAVAEFQQRVGSLSSDGDVRIIVSGPWPAAEFLDVRAKP